MKVNTSDSRITVDTQNNDETFQRIPAIVYLSVTMIIGAFGNALVILVYYGKLRRRNGAHWTFIRSMAVTDFLVCLIVIPFELYQQTHQLTFYSDIGCKLGRGITIFLSVLSCSLLILMSLDRFRRVCQPCKWQLNTKHASGNVCLAFFISILFSWPEAVLSGISLEQLQFNLTGHDCSFSDRFQETNYTIIYSLCLCLIYFICMLIIILVYANIAKDIFRRERVKPSPGHIKNIASISNTLPVTQKYFKRKRVIKKVTKIAFSISICFILSYIPYSVIKLNASIMKGRFVSNSVTKAIFPILSRFYILNNIINPLIYMCVDSTFLYNCKLLIYRIFCRNLPDRDT